MKIVIALIALTLLNVSSAQFSSSGGFQFGSNFGFPNPLDFALSASRFFADQFSSGIERLRQAQTGIQSAFDGAFSDFRQRFDDLRQAGQNFSEEIRHRALEQLEESRRQALEANRQFQENLSRQESLIRDRIRQLESSGRSGSAERRRYNIELSQIQQQIAQLREQERQLGFTFEFIFGFGNRFNGTSNSTRGNTTDIQIPQNRTDPNPRNQTTTTNTTLPNNQTGPNSGSQNQTVITNPSQQNQTQPIIPANNTSNANQPTINTSPVDNGSQTSNVSNQTNTNTNSTSG